MNDCEQYTASHGAPYVQQGANIFLLRMLGHLWPGWAFRFYWHHPNIFGINKKTLQECVRTFLSNTTGICLKINRQLCSCISIIYKGLNEEFTARLTNKTKQSPLHVKAGDGWLVETSRNKLWKYATGENPPPPFRPPSKHSHFSKIYVLVNVFALC